MEQIIQIKDIIIEFFNQYGIIILTALSIAIGAIVLSPMLAYIVLKMFNLKSNKKEIRKISFYKPMKIFFIILGIYIAIAILNLPQEVNQTATKIFKILVIILIANGFSNMANFDSRTFRLIQSKIPMEKRGKGLEFICKIIKTLIYIVAGFIIITELGYDLNGLVTSLGIGSVVIALAAQDIAKNLIGGFTILADRPFSVGDFIETSGYSGTVENITFRSTRIITFDNTEVTIPNGVLANAAIVNWSKMEKRRVKINISIDFDTTTEMLKRIEKRISIVLDGYPHVIKDSVNINYSEIEKQGINMYVYLFIDIVDYAGYLKVKSEINKTILEIIEKEKIKVEPAQRIKIQNM